MKEEPRIEWPDEGDWDATWLLCYYVLFPVILAICLPVCFLIGWIGTSFVEAVIITERVARFFIVFMLIDGYGSLWWGSFVYRKYYRIPDPVLPHCSLIPLTRHWITYENTTWGRGALRTGVSFPKLCLGWWALAIIIWAVAWWLDLILDARDMTLWAKWLILVSAWGFGFFIVCPLLAPTRTPSEPHPR